MPPSNLKHLVYLSTALQPFDQAALVELLTKSRTNNIPRDITGLLLYHQQHFMQAVEGPPEQVDALTEIIRRDERHCGMVTLIDEPISERSFPTWSMGFADLGAAEIRQLEGFSEFLTAPLTEEYFKDPTRVQKLLALFKKRL